MHRRWPAMFLGLGLATAGVGVARHDGGHGAVKPLAAIDIDEELDGKASRATAVEVSFEPGQVGEAHRHPGPAFGYVLEGEYEWAIDDRPAKVLKPGETFYEPAGCLHRVSSNPGKTKARILAWVLHPRDAGEIVVPPGHAE
ncbi:MAG: cupin [Planctomycetales bacterium 71-10]|mgnify:CR=1 FL=1|nr:MAG: cupin [Planctomycetales bacterium 71-10]